LYHPDFARLLEHLRHSIKDFALFEAVYLTGLSRRDLARMIGVTPRSLGRRLRSVRKAIARNIGDPEAIALHDNLTVTRDYLE